jgi:hypothetical protein
MCTPQERSETRAERAALMLAIDNYVEARIGIALKQKEISVARETNCEFTKKLRESFSHLSVEAVFAMPHDQEYWRDVWARIPKACDIIDKFNEKGK